jgi:hypothetical protein
LLASPSQSPKPAGHVVGAQLPALQTSVTGAHVLPQAPQSCGSFARFFSQPSIGSLLQSL